MKRTKKLFVALAVFALFCALIFAADNPQAATYRTYQTKDPNAPVVYFTRDISPQGFLKVYRAMGWSPEGKVGVKINTGEPPASKYLRPELIKDLVQALNGTIVECNTVNNGRRAANAFHHQVVRDHGFLEIAAFDLLDEDGAMDIPVGTKAVRLKRNIVGSHFANYDTYLLLNPL